jgi:hypothetical protein
MVVVIVGLETDQSHASGALPSVEQTLRDVEGSAEVLRSLLPEDRPGVKPLVDNDASRGSIKCCVRQAIGSLGEDDLFVLYDAGHDFHGAGSNCISTANETAGYHGKRNLRAGSG